MSDKSRTDTIIRGQMENNLDTIPEDQRVDQAEALLIRLFDRIDVIKTSTAKEEMEAFLELNFQRNPRLSRSSKQIIKMAARAYTKLDGLLQGLVDGYTRWGGAPGPQVGRVGGERGSE